MKIIRAVALAVIVSLTLLGSSMTVANAQPGAAVMTDRPGTASADPGDPGFPPDD